MTKTAPNILLITADQLRYDCVGYGGSYPVHTPNLDTLAAQSVAFTNAFSHIPLCCPARQSLLHGKRPETFGALWNYSGALPVASLQPEAFTWTRALADNGYRSAFLGKWGVHPSLDATSFGYDSYTGEHEYKRFADARYPEVKFSNGYFGESNPIPVADSRTHWFAGQAVERLAELRNGGGPWHLALHFAEPHLPCRPSGRFAHMYDPAEVPEWAGFRDTFEGKPYIQRQQLLNWGVEHYAWEDWAPVVARYYGMISQVDEAVGIVLQALEDSGEADDTIIVFTADHGDMCGSHGMMDKHYILYDDVVHVPLLIRMPDGLAGTGAGTSGAADDDADGANGANGANNANGTEGANGAKGLRGSRCDKFVYNFLDMAPTLLELAGVDAGQARLQGRSLMPLLIGREEAVADWRDAVVSTYNGQQFGLYTQRMIRTTRWKYVWNTTDTDELYDLAADPAELVNRIGDPDAAGAVASLRRRLYEQLAADGDGLVGNEWMRRQLLGGAKLGG